MEKAGLKTSVAMLFSQFSRSKDQKYYKNWINETVFVYILCFIFKSLFEQNFAFGSFFEQDQLLNLIILGV